MKRYCSLIILLCGCLLAAGCDEIKLMSAWRDREITIDGKDTEWQGHMMQVGNLYVGLRNDADYLYLCLTATDTRTKAQLVGLFKQSFSIWFDPEGKKKRTFGLQLLNESPFMDESLVAKVRFIRNPQFQIIVNEMMNNMEVEVLNDNYPAALLSEARGIDVAAGTAMNGRKLTYEFKIPLAKNEDHPYAIGTAPDKTICVGFETSKIDMDYVIERLDTDGESGNKDGSGHPRTGYRIVARSPEMDKYFAPIKYIELWGKVKLRSKPPQVQ